MATPSGVDCRLSSKSLCHYGTVLEQQQCYCMHVFIQLGMQCTLKKCFYFLFIIFQSELGVVSLIFVSHSTIIEPNLGNTFLIIRQFLVIQQQILRNHWFILNLGDMQISGYLLLFTLITGSRLGDVDEYFRSGVPLL